MSVYSMIDREPQPVATRTILTKILTAAMPSYKESLRTMRRGELAPIIRRHVTIGVKDMLSQYKAIPTRSDPGHARWERLVRMNTDLVGITTNDGFWAWYNRNA